MERFVFVILVTLSIAVLVPLGTSYGSSTQVSISTSKPIYKYGENLSFSITVSNVTGDIAVLEIVDQSNQSSSPINMIIKKPVSNITAPAPFYKTAFSPGTYFLKIQYAGSNTTTSFQLVDTGDIVIPPQFKEMASSWVQNQTSGRLFGENISYLVSSKIIEIDNYQEQNMVEIPTWFKNDALWWSNGSISDNDFGYAIKYLIESGVMKV
jgi:hypothetical protein